MRTSTPAVAARPMHLLEHVLAFSAIQGIWAAESYIVSVGVNEAGEPGFSPSVLDNVVPGDTVFFRRNLSGLHHIVESTFDRPCRRKQDGFGLPPIDEPSLDIIHFPIPDGGDPTEPVQPRWFFDAPSNNCQKGAVFALNPPSENAFADFRARAMGGDVGPPTGGNPPTPSGSTGSRTATQTLSSGPSGSGGAPSTPSGTSSGGEGGGGPRDGDGDGSGDGEGDNEENDPGTGYSIRSTTKAGWGLGLWAGIIAVSALVL